MKILVVSRGYPKFGKRTPGIFEYDQALALSKAGHEVIFAAVDLRSIRRFRRFGTVMCKSDNISVFSTSIPVGKVKKKLLVKIGRFAFKRLLKRILKQFGSIDLVHAHFTDIAAFVAPACSEYSIPLVVTEHSSAVNTASPDSNTLWICNQAYSSAKCVIAVSNSLARNLNIGLGITPTVVPNIVDTSLFTRPHIGGGDTLRLVSTGSLNHIKGHDLLLEGFCEFHKKHPNSSLTVFGDGPEKERLISLCSELKLDSCVTFRGMQKREVLAEEYPNFDAFILCSKSETFGVAFAEALASGLPVISTDCGGPCDFINDDNGIIIKERTGKAIADAIEVVINTQYDHESISRNITSLLSPDVIASRLTEIYKDLLSDEKQ